MGFDKQDDQSTYTLRARSDVSVREMKNEIVNWSECVDSQIDVEDRVDLYYVTVAELDEFNKAPVIDSVSFVYDVETEGLCEEQQILRLSWLISDCTGGRKRCSSILPVRTILIKEVNK